MRILMPSVSARLPHACVHFTRRRPPVASAPRATPSLLGGGSSNPYLRVCRRPTRPRVFLLLHRLATHGPAADPDGAPPTRDAVADPASSSSRDRRRLFLGLPPWRHGASPPPPPPHAAPSPTPLPPPSVSAPRVAHRPWRRLRRLTACHRQFQGVRTSPIGCGPAPPRLDLASRHSIWGPLLLRRPAAPIPRLLRSLPFAVPPPGPGYSTPAEHRSRATLPPLRQVVISLSAMKVFLLLDPETMTLHQSYVPLSYAMCLIHCLTNHPIRIS